MGTPFLGIDHVVRRTGLSAHVIRIWERRYGAVEPERTPGNHRVYSEEQVERLLLLRAATESGQSIGLIAKLPVEQLRTLVHKPTGDNRTIMPGIGADPAPLLEQAVVAVKNLDAATLENVLREADVMFGLQGLLQKIVGPFALRLGELWREGGITAAHEHFATAVLRDYLTRAVRSSPPVAGAPILVVATPAGQQHELGALLVAAGASNLGWHVTYLGASLPVAEIAGAARQQKARAVALSIVYPEDDPALPGELARLAEMLAPGTALILGGRAAAGYASALRETGAILAPDIAILGNVLDGLRKQRPAKIG